MPESFTDFPPGHAASAKKQIGAYIAPTIARPAAIRRLVPAPDPRRLALDQLVQNIELTLISIVSGVALYFLVDSTRQAIARDEWMAAPYVLTSVLLLLVIWVRSIIHAFTVIRWPIEIGHNAGYIVLAGAEALLFAQIGAPRRWFCMSLVIGVLTWAIYAFELRLFRARREDGDGVVDTRLLSLLEWEHRVNLYYAVPGLIATWGVFTWVAWPSGDEPSALLPAALAAIQALCVAGYFGWVLRFLKQVSARIWPGVE
jgi:hypothetical protein